MSRIIATKIPSLFRTHPLWLVETGPLPENRFTIEAADERSAIRVLRDRCPDLKEED